MAGAGPWCVGQEFKTFGEFEAAWNNYQKEVGASFFKHAAKTIALWNKGIKDCSKQYNEELVYKRLVLKCSSSGTFVSTSSGQRPHQKSLKQNCTALIGLTADRQRNCLVVKEVDLNHNHLLSPHDPLVPSNRKLEPFLENEVVDLISYGMPVHRAVDMLREKHGRPVLTRDIWNLTAKHRGSSSEEQEMMDHLKYLAEQDKGFTYHVSEDPIRSEIKVIFYQTSTMRANMTKYPGVLFIDGTYCVNKYGMPLYCFLVSDGERHGQPVGYAVVRDEHGSTIKEVLQLFVEKNKEACRHTQVVMIDKDCREISAVEAVLPQAHVSICRFHCLQIFDRQIAKKGSSSEEKEALRAICQKLVYAASDEIYADGVQQLTEIGGEFFHYFRDNWDAIKFSWVACHQPFNNGHFTNNILERHNRSIKTVIKSTSSIIDLVKATLLLETRAISSLAYRKRTIEGKTSHLTLSNPELPLAVVKLIYELCTPSMAEAVTKELENSYSESWEYNKDSGTLQSAKHIFQVTCASCACSFFRMYRLPCRHILFVRSLKGTILICEDDIPLQWQLQHYLSEVVTQPTPATYDRIATARGKKLTKREKFNASMELMTKFAKFMSVLGQDSFDDKFETLSTLLDDWKGVGSNVIQPVEEEEAEVELEAVELRPETVAAEVELEAVELRPDNVAAEVELEAVEVRLDAVHEEGEVEPDIVVTTDMAYESDHRYSKASTSAHTYSVLSDDVKLGAKLPRAIKVTGRPKGLTKTVIGRAKRKVECEAGGDTRTINYLKPFLLQNIGLVSILNGRKINRKMLRSLHEQPLSVANVTDEAKHFFTKDGWCAMLAIINAIKKQRLCCICQSHDDVSFFMDCTQCEVRYHYKCLGISVGNVDESMWKCNSCSSL